jgi:hypothetical protein
VCFSEGAEAVEEVVQCLAHGVPCEEHPQERLPLPPARVPCLSGLPPVQGPLRDAQGGGDLRVGFRRMRKFTPETHHWLVQQAWQ